MGTINIQEFENDQILSNLVLNQLFDFQKNQIISDTLQTSICLDVIQYDLFSFLNIDIEFDLISYYVKLIHNKEHYNRFSPEYYNINDTCELIRLRDHYKYDKQTYENIFDWIIKRHPSNNPEPECNYKIIVTDKGEASIIYNDTVPFEPLKPVICPKTNRLVYIL